MRQLRIESVRRINSHLPCRCPTQAIHLHQLQHVLPFQRPCLYGEPHRRLTVRRRYQPRPHRRGRATGAPEQRSIYRNEPAHLTIVDHPDTTYLVWREHQRETGRTLDGIERLHATMRGLHLGTMTRIGDRHATELACFLAVRDLPWSGLGARGKGSEYESCRCQARKYEPQQSGSHRRGEPAHPASRPRRAAHPSGSIAGSRRSTTEIHCATCGRSARSASTVWASRCSPGSR